MEITKQIELKAKLLNILDSVTDMNMADVEYLDDLIYKISENTDLGLIKLFLMQLYDVTTSGTLAFLLKPIIYDIKEVEPEYQCEIKGDMIEVCENIKLLTFYNELDSESLQRIKFKNKDVIITYLDEFGNTRHFVVKNLDFFIFSNTAELLNRIAKLLDLKESDNEDFE